MADYAETAKGVLAAIGGAGNVTHATHCVTRLRFNVRDKEQVDREAVKDVPGVLGEQFSGEQYQVIIGATVAKVYEEVCASMRIWMAKRSQLALGALALRFSMACRGLLYPCFRQLSQPVF